MELNIRKAMAKDIDIVAEIYDRILDNEERTGKVYTNWKKGLYPTKNDALAALDAGTLYVGEAEGKVLACVNLNHIQPPEYSKIRWSNDAEGNEVLVIHTLCIPPECAGKGFGRQFVEFSEKLAKEQGCRAVRLDTYEGNAPAASLYTKMGFTFVGSEDFNFQNVIMERLICFDKVIE